MARLNKRQDSGSPWHTPLKTGKGALTILFIIIQVSADSYKLCIVQVKFSGRLYFHGALHK